MAKHQIDQPNGDVNLEGAVSVTTTRSATNTNYVAEKEGSAYRALALHEICA